ncbi:zinc finger CCCH domain-containing protein 18-like isoform X1 [Cryptomeria japonica]|uniref:zinc finger CCCH domain-containing protein 18-like isoform X1 n=2 Tax=Cryptomeria japonica TaxID=3369 RepID=UPI0027DAA196|nr:zinc finger CCCH domain-containing protein 18-like isoform X1 [Cryptomeria japonica]
MQFCNWSLGFSEYSYWDRRLFWCLEVSMDAYGAVRIVYTRIRSLEPENVSEIIGYLLMQDLGDQEMIRLAFGPNALLQSMISKAKEKLGLSSSPPIHQQLLTDHHSPPFQYSNLLPPHYSNGFHWGSSHEKDSTLLTAQDLMHQTNFQGEPSDYLNLSRHQSLPPDLKFSEEPLFYPDSSFSLANDQSFYRDISPTFYNGIKPGSNHRRAYSMTDVSVSPSSESLSSKPCLYFARGYCKHGSNCRFSHNLSSPMIESISLEKLEMEMQELLRGMRAPVSIASLPQLYYERFGKTLQAEGYLTESQRHGKTGYSLTNLLARLKNTVTLIDRPHGQHAIILAEDAYRFTAYRSGFSNIEREDLGSINPASRQIYMTFPAESTFTEEDVSNYFGIYGPVQDVRIPYQQKRMFGFVTYVYPQTVKVVLAKGNPHYVCGARVLVKPYKEKSKYGDRKFVDRGEHSKYLSSHILDLKEYDSHLGCRLVESSEMVRRQMEEQEQAVELESLHFADLNLGDTQRNQGGSQLSMPLVQQNHFSKGFSSGLFNADQYAKASEVDADLNGFDPTLDQFSYVLDVLDSEHTNEVETKSKTDADDECNSGHNLPDSPFSVFNGIKTPPHPDKTKICTIFNNTSQESTTSGFTQIPLWSRCS